MIRKTLMEDLVRPLGKRLGERLVSVVVFGTALDYLDRKDPPMLADVNLAVVVDLVDLEVQEVLRPLLAGRDLEDLRITLFAADELPRVAEVFPVEAGELLRRHEVLHGRDPWARGHVPAENLEHQVAFEVLSKRQVLRSLLLTHAPKDAAVGRQLLLMEKAFAPLVRRLLEARGGNPPVSREELLVFLVERWGLPPEGAEAIRDLQATHEDRRRPAAHEKRDILEAFVLAWDWLAELPRRVRPAPRSSRVSRRPPRKARRRGRRRR